MTDHTELRRKAEAATQDEWRLLQATKTIHVVRNVPSICIAHVGYSGNDKQDLANGEYIAAANPAAIIALLDEIDALKAAQADMVLVPRVPTEAMVQEARYSMDCPASGTNDPASIYAAMIEAATKEKP